jgi:nicotinamide N-methyltransferase
VEALQIPVMSVSEPIASSSAEHEDLADILDISLPALFSIAPIAFSTPTPTSFHTYLPPPPHTPIQLRLPNPSAEVYSKLQANHLWLSALYLADLIHLQKIQVQGQIIAELGAGAGLPSLSACRLGAKVVASDWGDRGILEALEDNFTRTCPAGGWAVRGHEWGTDPTPLLDALDLVGLRTGPHEDDDLASRLDPKHNRFDKLFLADTLWVTEAHSALLDSVWNLLKPGGIAHIAAGLHTGRGPLWRFIEMAEKRGGTVMNQKEVLWKAEDEWEEGAVSSSSGLEEERGVVVYLELRVGA